MWRPCFANHLVYGRVQHSIILQIHVRGMTNVLGETFWHFRQHLRNCVHNILRCLSGLPSMSLYIDVKMFSILEIFWLNAIFLHHVLGLPTGSLPSKPVRDDGPLFTVVPAEPDECEAGRRATLRTSETSDRGHALRWGLSGRWPEEESSERGCPCVVQRTRVPFPLCSESRGPSTLPFLASVGPLEALSTMPPFHGNVKDVQGEMARQCRPA